METLKSGAHPPLNHIINNRCLGLEHHLDINMELDNPRHPHQAATHILNNQALWEVLLNKNL